MKLLWVWASIPCTVTCHGRDGTIGKVVYFFFGGGFVQ